VVAYDARHGGQADAGTWNLVGRMQALEWREEVRDKLHVEPATVVTDEKAPVRTLAPGRRMQFVRNAGARSGHRRYTHPAPPEVRPLSSAVECSLHQSGISDLAAQPAPGPMRTI
jgi:hypothetical protein